LGVCPDQSKKLEQTDIRQFSSAASRKDVNDAMLVVPDSGIILRILLHLG